MKCWDDGSVSLYIPNFQKGPWTHLGFAPKPRTRWQRFWRHWHHGRIMGYPRLSVLAWCIRNDLTLKWDY